MRLKKVGWAMDVMYDNSQIRGTAKRPVQLKSFIIIVCKVCVCRCLHTIISGCNNDLHSIYIVFTSIITAFCGNFDNTIIQFF